MTSEDIRARIADWETADAESGASHDRRRSASPTPQDSTAEKEPWPWDFLFDSLPAGSASAGENAFSLEDWLSEGLRGLRGYLRSQGLDDEFWGHMRAAEREFLLAWRCLIDARLRRWEERQKSNPPDLGRRQAIDIEFE